MCVWALGVNSVWYLYLPCVTYRTGPDLQCGICIITATSRNSQQCFTTFRYWTPFLHQLYPYIDRLHFHIIPVNFSLFIARFHNQNSVCISRFRHSFITSRIYGSENKQTLFTYTELTDWGFFLRDGVCRFHSPKDALLLI